MNVKIAGLALALAVALLMWRLDSVTGHLDAERLNHAATAKERDQWRAAAEAYRQDADAQAESARLCLDREAQAALDAAERAAIMRQAKPRPRPKEEQEKVVDDETRNRVADRLNRAL